MRAKVVYLAAALVLVASMAAAIVPSAAVALSTIPEPTDVATEDGAEAALMNLPLYFVENQGQMDQRVAYYVQGRDMGLYFTAQGVTFAMSGPGEEADSQERYAIKLGFVGADPDIQPVGKDLTEAIISYFTGSYEEWKTGLPTYAGVVYPDLWPGIDLVYSGDASRLKYTFLVQPGADPGQIRLAYSGASSVILNEGGQLEVSTPVGGFQDDRPVAYQDVGGKRVPVESSYALDEDTYSYGFGVGSYDPGKLLVIDPAVLVYCGYIGGSDRDWGYGIVVDGAGCAYVTGETYSDEATFPVTVGPDLEHNDVEYGDAFVAKVNAGGTGLVYCGYIGGNETDRGYGIAVDGSGCAYVTGVTYSGEATFPVTVGPDLDFNGGYYDAFVAKVWGNGSGLDYCGYIGGNKSDNGYGIDVDGSGCAYVTGYTKSSNTTFPDAVGPDTSFNGGTYDAFVAKVKANPNSTTPENNYHYCGYIGGSKRDEGLGIAVDGSDCAYVTGYTTSNQSEGFPVKVGPDTSYNLGSTDAFVAKVSANGTVLDYCGYIGGSEDDRGLGIAVDGSDCAYVTGYTDSDDTSFPDGYGFGTLTGPDTGHNGGDDAFVAKVNAGGTGLVYCGYIGGSEDDRGRGIAVDGSGCAYVAGETKSNETTEGFPVAVGPDLIFNGVTDAFVAKVKANPNDPTPENNFDYCGYIGGSSVDWAYGIAVDGDGCTYVTGYTYSDEATFPDTVGPYLNHNGDEDAFVAKVCETEPIVPVGGVIEPVDRLQILAPWLGIAVFIIVAMAVMLFIVRRRVA